MTALIEYHFSAPGPLTRRERLTGWRTFTARSGYVLRFRVGWRLSLYWATHPFEWWAVNHRDMSDPYEDDD